ncbi:regulator of nucleoside diphosphate kinase [Daejeonella rubra]|uniref:Regulator of nucleoside diphosphate kinase n=1 Tax=Daejeonella rubra TaxID=990371 RepID=A0A1G9LSQ8_9SPHI|nr:GreA/GreB family elongation factor [Daejeonella rubra]SDL64757.1 regulator of nucleoside diphosphate kinase [Daejeonella rubra]
MKIAQLILSKTDFELLKSHLKLSTNLSEFNKKKLILELKTARVLNSAEMPDDVVSENSKVQIKDVASGQTFDFILVAHQKADPKMNKISVLAPIGIALLGYRPGIEVDWEMPNGLRTFRIVSVERMPVNH